MATLKMLLLIAARNLWMARRRTLFLGSALSVVTALLVLLMALSQGLSENIIRSATTLNTGHVNVAGFFKSTSTDSAPLITDTAALKRIVRREVPEIDYVVDRGRALARISSETAALTSLLAGVRIEEEPQLTEVLEIAPLGSYHPGGGEQRVGEFERLKEPNTAVLFATQAARLEVQVGDKITLRTQSFSGQANTVDVTIVAVARDIGILSNFSVFVPGDVVRDLNQLKPDTSGAIQIYLRDIDDAPAVRARLAEALEREGYELMEYQPAPFFAKFETVSGEDWIGQKLDLTTWEDETEFLSWILTALDTVSFGLVGILIAIIAVGVMNAMWIAVRKRTTEIGTLRAVGRSRARVWWMFLFEALLLGLGAALCGAAVGVIIALSVSAAEVRIPVDAVRAILLSDTLRLSIAPRQLFGAVALMTLFTALSAIWPAARAAALQPVEAIQQIRMNCLKPRARSMRTATMSSRFAKKALCAAALCALCGGCGVSDEEAPRCEETLSADGKVRCRDSTSLDRARAHKRPDGWLVITLAGGGRAERPDYYVEIKLSPAAQADAPQTWNYTGNEGIVTTFFDYKRDPNARAPFQAFTPKSGALTISTFEPQRVQGSLKDFRYEDDSNLSGVALIPSMRFSITCVGEPAVDDPKCKGACGLCRATDRCGDEVLVTLAPCP